MDETLTVSVEADTSGFETALKGLESQAHRFGNTMSGALKNAAVHGKSFEEVMRSIARSLAGRALDGGLAPLSSMLNSAAGRLFSGLGGIVPFANGGVASTGLFGGQGGVIAAPTYFPHGRSTGLAGEAGREAVLPLRRTADGQLGVASDGGASGGPSITVNISTPDIAGFHRSQSQVSAALTRAVMRGQRGV